MHRAIVAAAVIVAFALVISGVLIAASDDGIEFEAHLTDMQSSAAALAAAGAAMERHALPMLADGRAAGDPELIRHGEHWLADGQALVQRAEWLVMSPTSPGSLIASPADLGRDGSWAELNRRTQQMLHDPSKARGIDIVALRLNGAAMQAEGRLMAEHGRQMTEEITLMVALHGLDGVAADELRATTVAMVSVGEHLEQNGKAMIDYADRIARTLGR
jgi:hypothetical protein